MDDYESRIGSVIAGRFQLTELISVGGMGAIFHAKDLKLTGECALKILREELREQTELKRRFFREARAAAHLGHPNIVRVIDLGETDDGVPFLVMEYLQGADLGRLVREHGPLSWEQLAPMMIQVCRALQHAHERGIIHRDIKPSNLMVLGEWPVSLPMIKVIDLGIVMLTAGSTMQTEVETTVGVVGTPSFMAPELHAGLARATAVTDVFSLGVTMYAVLTAALPRADDGKVPPPSVRARASAIPAAADAVVLKALSFEPGRRYATMRELEVAIAGVGEPIDDEVTQVRRLVSNDAAAEAAAVDEPSAIALGTGDLIDDAIEPPSTTLPRPRLGDTKRTRAVGAARRGRRGLAALVVATPLALLAGLTRPGTRASEAGAQREVEREAIAPVAVEVPTGQGRVESTDTGEDSTAKVDETSSGGWTTDAAEETPSADSPANDVTAAVRERLSARREALRSCARRDNILPGATIQLNVVLYPSRRPRCSLRRFSTSPHAGCICRVVAAIELPSVQTVTRVSYDFVMR